MSEVGDLLEHLEGLAASQEEPARALEEIAKGLERLREWIAPYHRPKLEVIQGGLAEPPGV